MSGVCHRPCHVFAGFSTADDQHFIFLCLRRIELPFEAECASPAPAVSVNVNKFLPGQFQWFEIWLTAGFCTLRALISGRWHCIAFWERIVDLLSQPPRDAPYGLGTWVLERKKPWNCQPAKGHCGSPVSLHPRAASVSCTIPGEIARVS